VALTASERFGVDISFKGTIDCVSPRHQLIKKEWSRFSIGNPKLPEAFAHYVACKGSIAVNGDQSYCRRCFFRKVFVTVDYSLHEKRIPIWTRFQAGRSNEPRVSTFWPSTSSEWFFRATDQRARPLNVEPRAVLVTPRLRHRVVGVITSPAELDFAYFECASHRIFF